ncbi:hypothetical protein C8R45DRAFT_986827 [Mycena sanguinolenta]|nr:hypothetical protein C8R45DRAFT_986827 [Mycena sanguinolenta]
MSTEINTIAFLFATSVAILVAANATSGFLMRFLCGTCLSPTQDIDLGLLYQTDHESDKAIYQPQPRPLSRTREAHAKA